MRVGRRFAEQHDTERSRSVSAEFPMGFCDKRFDLFGGDAGGEDAPRLSVLRV